MWRPTLARGVLFLMSAEYSVVMCGACRGPWLPAGSHLTVASSQYNILLCSETLVSDVRHLLELLVPGFGRPVLLCWGKLRRARGTTAYVRDAYGAFRQPKFECGCCECGYSVFTATLSYMTGFLIVYYSIDGCRAG